MLRYRNNRELYDALGRKPKIAIADPVEATIEEVPQDEAKAVQNPEEAVVVESYPIAKDFEAVLNKL